MHAAENLPKFLNEVCSFMHSKRRASLCSVLSSSLGSRSLGVTSLGRGIKRRALEKHRIKQADRLLSNQHLQQELEAIYGSVSRRLLSGAARPVILIDWSNLDSNERHFLLRASVPTKGRALTVYEEIHTRRTKEKLLTHTKFLKKLAKILPRGVRPIIVADAGFRATWFKAVERQGWDWVGRIRGRMKVRLDKRSSWIPGRSLQAEAPDVASNFASAQIAERNRLDCRLVLFKASPKGRVLRNKFGKRGKRNRALRAERAGRDPLLLATSLPTAEFDANRIVHIYSSRMQIEESFRDMKSGQYGLGLKDSRTYKTKRLAVLVAIASFANTFCWILGRAIENRLLHRHFQANSLSDSPALSYVFLGRRVFEQRRIRTSWADFKDACDQLTIVVRRACFT